MFQLPLTEPALVLGHRSGDCMIDWQGYTPFASGLLTPLDEMPRSEAQRAFDRLMEHKDRRVEELRQLLSRNGVELRDQEDDLRAFETLLFGSVREEHDGDELSGLWLGLALDAGLFLGDVSIARSSSLSWRMCEADKDDILYQRPVIMGFKNVRNKRYRVDFPGGVAMELDGYLAGRIARDPDFFVGWLDEVHAYA